MATNEPTRERERETQINLIAPQGLVEQAKQLAERLDLSLSQLVRKLLREAIQAAAEPSK
jgi:antitoxin component of RelBE/YafQ-DinJ toxin-antitoxin module